MQTTDFGRTLRNLALAGAVIATSAGALAAPALARDWDHGRGQAREWRHDRDDWGTRPYVAVTPGYGYYYDPYAYNPYAYAYPAPAPVYVAPPAIDFVFPIHIR